MRGPKLPEKAFIFFVFILFVGIRSVTAAEIPPNASLEDGISILQEATLTETFETAAAFVQLPNGQTKWISQEGEEQMVNLFENHDGEGPEAIASFLRDIIDNHEIRRREPLIVDHYHNHPTQSLFPTYSGAPFSIPPSGKGFLTNGDTGFEKHKIFQTAIEEVEEETGVSIEYRKRVLDAKGVWTWSYIEESVFSADPAFLAKKRLSELYNQYEEGWRPNTPEESVQFDRERLQLLRLVDSVHDKFHTTYSSWVQASYGEDYNVELAELINAFEQVGVLMSFIPHDDARM